jgi:hypothetical protein
MGVHISNINDILEYMEIDENIFSLKVYKDQEEFLIKDEKILMERLMSEKKMYNYHKMTDLEKKNFQASQQPSVILQSEKGKDEDEISVMKF